MTRIALPTTFWRKIPTSGYAIQIESFNYVNRVCVI